MHEKINKIKDFAKTLHDADLSSIVERLLEERLIRHSRQLKKSDANLESLEKDANEEAKKAKSRRYSLLTDDASNAKTAKSAAEGNHLTAILHLAPSSLAGCGDMCPASSEGCRQSCLNTAGRGGMIKHGEDTNTIQEARIRRTKLLHENPDVFWNHLISDVYKVKAHAAREGKKPVIRLNGTSDLAWESFRPPQLGGKNIFEAHPDVQFYDYTKRPERAIKQHPENYHLTFSRSEVNDNMAQKVLKAGKNVAVVFGGKKLPQEWNGHKVVSGDEHDLRFLDPKGGYVIGLTAKGDAKSDKSGFVVWGHSGDPQAKPSKGKVSKFHRIMNATKRIKRA